MANNEAGGSGTGTGSGSADKDKEEMQQVWQLCLDARRYMKSMDNLMKKMLDNEKAESEIARSVELDKEQLIQNLAQLSQWVTEQSDLGTKLLQVKEIKITIRKLIEYFKMHSKKYQEETKAKMEDNEEEMTEIGFTLDCAYNLLSGAAERLTALKDK